MLHSAIQPRIDELAFYDSGLRIVRHFWFVETKPEFATLHCVRVSPDWGGIAKSLRHDRASRGIEMRRYGFGRYFHQNRDIGDGSSLRRPSSGPRAPFGLPPLCAMTNCSMPINIFFTTDAVKNSPKLWRECNYSLRSRARVLAFASRHNNSLDINGLDNIRRQGEHSLCSAAALREPTHDKAPRRSPPAAPNIRRISKRSF